MKKYRKRIIPILLVITLSITWISMPNGKIKSYAEETPSAGEWLDTTIRGVADTLEDLPQYGDPDYLSKARGTAERPFLIVEIVPYEEYGEFGYNIGGCEPVAIEKMHGRGAMNEVQSMGASTVKQTTVYFFQDEPESNSELYDGGTSLVDWQSMDQKGYYELVEEGTGNFRQVPIDPLEEALMATETEETETAETQQPETEAAGTEATETQQPETEAAGTEATETQQPETEAAGTEATETIGTETPDTEAAGTEATETIGTETPDTEAAGTEATETIGTETPDTEAAEATETPDTEAAGTPATEAAEATEATETIGTETIGTETPDTEAAGTTDTEAAEATGTETPDTEAAGTPEAENAESAKDTESPQTAPENAGGAAAEEESAIEEKTPGKADKEEQPAGEEAAEVVKNENPAKVRTANAEKVSADAAEDAQTAGTDAKAEQTAGADAKATETEETAQTAGTEQTAGADAQATETEQTTEAGADAKAEQTTGTDAKAEQATEAGADAQTAGTDAKAEQATEAGTDAKAEQTAGTDAKAEQTAGADAQATETEATAQTTGTEESGEAAQTDTVKDSRRKIALENKINDMLKTAGQEMEIVPEVGGNLIWHSVQEFELEKYTAQGIDFTDSVGKVLVNEGDRIYTTRRSSKEDPVVMITSYYMYQHNEAFLTKTLGLSQEEAAEYSVLVKTITPGELNQNPEWVDYADLFYVSPKIHVGAAKDLWINYRRLEHKQPASEYRTNQFEYDDLDWETTLKIYMKVNAKANYAPIIMDDNFFNPGEYIKDTMKKGIRLKVYDWNLEPALEQTGGTPDVTINGSNNNIWKLAVMLMCMDSTPFQNLYLKGENPIVRDGLCTLQEGDAAEYWNVETFFLLKPGKNTWTYFSSDEFWENFHSVREYTARKNWTNGRVFAFPGNTSVSQNFNTELPLPKKPNGEPYFKEFEEWLELNGKKSTAAAAIEFILSYGGDSEEPQGPATLRVLDLEPSVGLKSDSLYAPDWGLTETYLYMLLPFFDGDIEIVHQTTAEFIGKTEDLVSTYQMIYLGLDCGAYHTQQKSLQLSSGWVTLNVPDWNDNSKDGLIYLHSGDAVKSTETSDVLGNRSAKWLWSWKWNEDVANADTLYFAGNDISKNKQEDLENFVLSGHPVVAEEYLYNLERALIDPAAYICNFIQWAKGQGQGLYSAADSDGIKEAVARTLLDSAHVAFTQLPPEYDGTTADGASAQVTAPNYLPTDGSGTPYLEFGFSTDAEGYAYNVYVDQNRDGKLDWTEKAADQAPAAAGANSFGCQIVGWKQTVGQVLWKIEVYNAANPAISYTRSGCSAAGSASTGLGRKEVSVLQIMPKDGETDGAYEGELNLEKNELFRKYYEDLADYNVTVKSITAEEYEGYFYAETTDAAGNPTETSYGFSYNSKDGTVLNEEKLQGGLANYDIMVVGFGADFGQRDLDNTYGAVDYMRYFQSQPDRGIIFTHDVTSMYNLASGADKPTGYTANMLLRDIMGMNRYRSINKQAAAETKDALRDYQQKHFYDVLWYTGRADRGQDKSAEYQQNHGYTYYTMKRIAGAGGYRMPYRYLTGNGATLGYNDNVDLTSRAVKMNEGQIASYPYKIDSEIGVAPTHAQWYQLNPEDEDLTVWYCLAADGSIESPGSGSDGNSLIYQVSPKDAMNNYYAYSKGNVYYSGIGHSGGVGDMEAKLFVNMLIAAYRDNDREDLNVTYEPPEIEITNVEAIEAEQPDGANRREYSIEQISSFDGLEADGFYGIEEADSGDYDIHFKPVDENGIPVQLECTIQYTNESGAAVPVEQVQDAGGSVISADGDHKFTALQSGQEYILKYPKKYLVDDEAGNWKAMRTISFEIKNDLAEEAGTTIVRMTLQPLFLLD